MDAEEVSLATQPQTAAVRLSARLRGGPSELISTGLQRTGQVSRCSVSVCCDRPQNTPNVSTPSPRQRPTGDASAREERGISGKRESTPSQHFHRGFKKKRRPIRRDFGNSSYPYIFRDGTKTKTNKSGGNRVYLVW